MPPHVHTHDDSRESDSADCRSSTSSMRRERRKLRQKAHRETGDKPSNRRRSLLVFFSDSYSEFTAHMKSANSSEADAPRAPSQSTLPQQQQQAEGSDSLRRKPSKLAVVSHAIAESVSSVSTRYSHRRKASEAFKNMCVDKDTREEEEADAVAKAAASIARPSISTESAKESVKILGHQDSTAVIPPPPTLLSRASEARSTASLPEEKPQAQEGMLANTPLLAGTHAAAGNSKTAKSIDALGDDARGASAIPEELQHGEPLLKVTQKKVMQRVFRLDADRGQILWDSKKNNKVNLESIREVRVGRSASSYRLSLSISAAHEPRWISIIYQTGGIYKALHLIALSETSLERWRSTLEAVQSLRRDVLGGADTLDARHQLWLRQHWRSGDASQDERLDFAEVVKLCRRLGIESSRRDLKARFKEADKQGKGHLDFGAFQQFVKILKRRSELETIFDEWADVDVSAQTGSGDSVTASECPIASEEAASASRPTRGISQERFRAFLVNEQRFDSDNTANQDTVFRKYYQPQASSLLLEGFSAFLLSSDNAIIADERPGCTTRLAASANAADSEALKSRARAQTTDELLKVSAREPAGISSKVLHDMTRPMSDYYISSSHNTYLVGGQWKGDSTVEGYVRALQGGARSVELDCWDGPHDVPQITHGHTLTSKVPFADVIAAIGRYAFVTSPYPLILSLEVHNEIAQQDVMAQILKTTLGEMLLSERLSGPDAKEALPSPEALRGKILIKTKNLYVIEADKQRAQHEEMAAAEAVTVESQSTSTDNTESEGDSAFRDLVRSVTKRGKSKRTSGSSAISVKGSKVLMSAALASLLIYTVGVKHRGINKKETYAIEHMISLSEKSAFKYARSAPDDLIKHNLTHLTRIYPSMSSIARLHASANFLPHHMWATGNQLVALNWQTLDLGFELNRALFLRNGRCGYVLKPEGLRNKEFLKSSGKRLRFGIEVTIVSAQQLPRFKDAARDRDSDDDDVIDPFVTVTVLTPESWGKQPMLQQPKRKMSSNTVSSESSISTARNLMQKSASNLSGTMIGEALGLVRQTSRELREEDVSPSSQPTLLSASPPCRSLLPAVTRRPMGPPTPLNSNAQLNPPEGRAMSSDSSASLGIPPTGSLALSTPAAKLGAALATSSINFTGGSSSSSRLPRNFPSTSSNSSTGSSASSASSSGGPPRARTSVVKGNGYNPQWHETLRLHIDVPAGADAASETHIAAATRLVGDQGAAATEAQVDLHCLARGLLDLAFLRFEVCEESGGGDTTCLAAYTTSLGAMQRGYRHVPLYDAQVTPYMFSTIFVRTHLSFLGTWMSDLNSTSNNLALPSSITSVASPRLLASAPPFTDSIPHQAL